MKGDTCKVTRRPSEYFPKGEVDANGTAQGMVFFSKGGHSMVSEASGSAPYCHVAVFKAEAAYGIGTALAAPQEYGGHAERNGHDRRPRVLLVSILMEA